MKTLLNLLLLCCAARVTHGIYCHKCEDATSHAGGCNQVMSCGVQSGCFVQTWLNDEGTRYYSKGCFNTRAKKCGHFSDNCTPQQPLLECCNTSLCNTGDALTDWKPLVPKNLEIEEQANTSSILLTWARQCDDLYAYIVQYARHDGTFTSNTSNVTTDNSILIGPLDEGNYTFALRSYHSSVFSEIISIRTQIHPSPPSTIVQPGSAALSRTSLIIIIVVALVVVFLLLLILVCRYLVRSRKQQARYDVDRIYSIPTYPGIMEQTTNAP